MTATRLFMPEMKLLLRDLESGPATVSDLVPVLRISRRGTTAYVREAYAAGLIRISGYERVHKQGGCTKIYALKLSPLQRDCPRPAPLGPTEAQRIRRAQPEVREKENVRQREYKRRKREAANETRL